MKLRVFSINADAIELFKSIMTKIPQVGHSLEEFGILGKYSPSLDSVENLGSMEATGADITIFEDGPTVDFHPKSMGPVVDDLQTMAVSDLLNPLYLTGNAIHMRSENGRGPGSNRRFNQVRVDGQFVRKDIHEYRLTSLPDDARSRGHIRKRRGDNFSLKSEGFNSKLQGDGTVGDKEEVIYTQVIFKPQFKFIDQRTVVGQPIPFPNAIKVLLVFSFRWKKRLGYGDHWDVGEFGGWGVGKYGRMGEWEWVAFPLFFCL